MSALRWRLQFLFLVLGLTTAGLAAAQGLWQIPNEFVDEFGTRTSLSHWTGPQTIVAMEYSECKFVCSTNWRRLLQIQDEADRRKIPLRFLIISLDPAHDTPAAWRDYRKARGMKRENWSFITGNRQSTDRVAALLGVKWWYFNDAILHDFRVIRLNGLGNTLAVLDNFDEPAAAFLDR